MLKLPRKVADYFPYSTVRPFQDEFTNTVYKAVTSAQVKYYENCFPGYGREYGYVLPALKKASQAAGRPVRTLEDHGAIVFLDYRFATDYCRRFLPLWVCRGMKTLPDNDGVISKELAYFFGSSETDGVAKNYKL